MDFRVRDGRAEFRVFRNNRATAAMRRHMPESDVTDPQVLRRMKYLRRHGYANASVGALAKHFRADPVQVLGAVERVQAAFRRWVNSEKAGPIT